MTKSTDDLYRRALVAADAEGRLPLPAIAEWETFPFEGDLRVKLLAPPTEVDRPRTGETGADCWRCQRGTAARSGATRTGPWRHSPSRLVFPS